MTERHVIAYAILLACLIGAGLLWYLMRRGRRVSPHLRIDLLNEARDEPPSAER